MSKPKKPSDAAIKAHPAPVRGAFETGEKYAQACKAVSEARIQFDIPPNKRVKAGTSRDGAADRRALFIEAYLTNGGNQTQAAITAGFSVKRARATGADLVADSNIWSEIQRRRKEALAYAEEKTGITLAGVLTELRGIVHSDLRKCFNRETGALLPPHLWPDDVARAMASVKVVEMAGAMKVGADGSVEHVPMYTKEVKFWDKNAALTNAMKHLGAFEEDNKQRRPLADMDAEALDRLIARKAKELGVTLH